MKVLVLGGAGRIAREAALDLATYGYFDRITLADIDGEAAAEVAAWINRDHVDSVAIDIRDEDRALEIMRGYDLVMDALTIKLNETATRLIGLAGCHGVNLNGFGAEYAFDDMFKYRGKIMIPGFGMTPGGTNMMAKWVCDLLEEVDTVRISHGAFRPIAFSRSIAETTLYEYDDNLSGRVVFENGKMIQVKPFSRPLEVELPVPYGKSEQFIIPHSETQTLAAYLTNKNVKLIEVRGTWPERNMRLLRAYTRNVGIPFAIAGHLIASGRFEGTGVCAPERALEPGGVFMELARRGIMVHEQITS